MCQLFELEGHHDEIRAETFTLDLPSGWRRKAGGRQPDRSVAGQWDHAFDRALAEGLGTEQHPSAVVLQRAGDQFGLPCCAAVDEHHKRHAPREIARGGADPLEAGGFAPLDDDDVALVDEGVGYGHRAIEGPSGIVAQVDDEADQLAARPLAKILNRAGKRWLCGGVEAANAEVADVSRFDTSAHGLQLVRLAPDGQIDRLAGTAPQSELGLASDQPAQLLLGLSQGEIVNRLLVD